MKVFSFLRFSFFGSPCLVGRWPTYFFFFGGGEGGGKLKYYISKIRKCSLFTIVLWSEKHFSSLTPKWTLNKILEDFGKNRKVHFYSCIFINQRLKQVNQIKNLLSGWLKKMFTSTAAVSMCRQREVLLYDKKRLIAFSV